jgi:phosphoglycerol transferase MdoB-like AlkP superfamily enzyme
LIQTPAQADTAGKNWPKAIWISTILLFIVAGYMLLYEYIGGFTAIYSADLWVEAVLVLYLYYLAYWLLRPTRWRALLAAIPIILIYLIGDIFYLALGKVFRLVNFQEVPELLEILPIGYSIAIALSVLLPLCVLALHIVWRQHPRTALLVMPLLTVILLLYSNPAALARAIENTGDLVIYSDAKSVERNGRLTMMIYHAAQRREAISKLEPYRNRERYESEIRSQLEELQPLIDRQNVHLIVLESFLDPRLFTKLGFSSPPAHPDFVKLFGDKLGYSISPVFGGATAQAEFEVICGIPALELFSGIEFDVFNGAEAHCLPGLLTSMGYQTSASNAYKPNFFNAVAAYQGAGFSSSYFPKEFSGVSDSYLSFAETSEAEEYLFDQDLFDQNLKYVGSYLQQHPDKPLFNYMMTVYGHTPHLLDPELRPEYISLVSDYPDDHLTRSVNQFYYRTAAIANYVNELIKLDPNSLIILISDHVPPLRNGPNTYQALGYMNDIENADYYNRIAIINRGVPEKRPVMHHYEVPSLILDYLSHGAWCKTGHCAYANSTENSDRKQWLEPYMRLMAHATE